MKEIHNIAQHCAQKGVTQFVLSPGSRCAPLTISLVRHPEIETITISDERSAAFIALGMAQKSKKAVGLVCTSGSAMLNYMPAIAEAYFQGVPLLILTADRPPEWIEEQDGQTIHQTNTFGKHVKESYSLPVDYIHPDAKWKLHKTVSEAINTMLDGRKAPVHINIPLREPLYPTDVIEFAKVKTITKYPTDTALTTQTIKDLSEEIKSYNKIVIVMGQGQYSNKELAVINEFSLRYSIPVVTDIISNGFTLDNAIRHQDLFLANKHNELTPDLLITIGDSVISKNLKLFLRNSTLSEQWHIGNNPKQADTFQCLTKILPTTISDVFERIGCNKNTDATQFLDQWKSVDIYTETILHQQLKDLAFGEFRAIEQLINNIPEGSDLHLANSMSVRYANHINSKKTLSVWANRGTSGIDGSTSTAIGCALKTDKFVTLITGDLAFFYDRNAFWNNYPCNNLRILLINNNAGGIFRMIPGPRAQDELEEYFETKQDLNAQSLCNEFGIEHLVVKSEEELQDQLKVFYEESDKPKLMEVFSNKQSNLEVLTAIKKAIEE